MKKGIVLFLFTLCFTLTLQGTSQAEKNYVFGVHPFKNPAKLMKMFTPLREYLGNELGAKVTFRSAKNYDAALQALLAGEIDISYMGPSLIAAASKEHPGKVRIAAAILNAGKPTFKGVIVARQDSPINNLKDLAGKKIAFGDRKSTLSCYVPAHMLMEAGIFDSLSYEFVGSHDNVALGVLKKKFDAGGLKPGVALKYVDKGLKIIAESDLIYEHVVVVGPSVDDATFKKIQNALLNVKDPKVYTSIKKSVTGFAVVQPSDYDNLAALMKVVDSKIAK